MGPIRLLPQRPLLFQICQWLSIRSSDPAGRCLPQKTWIFIHTEGRFHILREDLGTWEKQKTHKDGIKLFLIQCFSEAGGQGGGSGCQSKARTRNLPWKGNFPPGQGSRPESQAVFYQPESPGRPGAGPAHTLSDSQGLRGI